MTTPRELGHPIGVIIAGDLVAEAPIVGGKPGIVGIRVLLVARLSGTVRLLSLSDAPEHFRASRSPLVRLGWS